MSRHTEYYAISAKRKGTRKSTYPPYEIEAWEWEIVCSNDTPFGLREKAKAQIETDYFSDPPKIHLTDTERHDFYANVKVIARSRLSSYHITLEEDTGNVG